MQIATPVRRLAVVAVVGAIAVVAAGGVGYAAASSAGKPVTACANAKGKLALQNKKGKCAAGYKRVTIGKQGPRGAAGAKGAKGAAGAAGPQGAPGAQGPGAVVFDEIAFDNDTTSTVTVDGFGYQGQCTVTGTGSSRSVTAKLLVTPPANTSARITALSASTLNGGTPVPVAYQGSAASTTQDVHVGASDTDTRILYNPAMHVIGGNRVQVVSINMTAKAPVSGFVNVPCSFEGTITAAS
ncbi:hypothetical protein SAMN05443575_0843 [Jatrophihabitans endophyticus]|uniref:Collagen triple helix repeat-containing protein n=1 Tax=Jatrophihabitans endophyticus TaxID=1206085 RepID=A0A1M5EBV2_9ACTN|nr:hypothetical protein [Jatrophihabitans endophyticus]SHF76551.1 hypothetical protein SAMN05443575_0843 [Jatrophihabitans endophyticus]